MLTKELLAFSRRAGAIHLKFLPLDASVLRRCEEMLALYREAQNRAMTRQSLEEYLEPMLKAEGAGKMAAGLNKLILDHAEFQGAGAKSLAGAIPELDPAARREAIFKAAAKLLASPPADAARYRQMIAELAGGLPEDLYGDLPACDRLVKVPEWSAKELRNRYNVALVQGVLGYAQRLVLTVEAATPMELRKFLRRLKFFRLLAEVTKASGNQVTLEISAPGAIFGESRVYGQNLANFFPAVLLLKNWRMSATVKFSESGEAAKLNLAAAKCDLVSTFPRWSSYVPEEVAMFLRAFRAADTGWEEAPDAEFPKAANQGVLFPDFSFAKKDDKETVVHVELFHRWHAKALEERIKWLNEHPETRYVIGIDHDLIGRSEAKEFRKKYQLSEKRYFFFSNYPGVEKVRQKLDDADEKTTPEENLRKTFS